MITFFQPPAGQAHPGHIVKVKKAIGSFPSENQTMHVMISRMAGRIYKPGKDKEGHWLDKEGLPDTRYMVYGSNCYAVGTKEDLDAAFDEQ